MKVTIALIVFICAIAVGVIVFCLNLPFGRSIGVTFNVVDDMGSPVSEARIKGYFNDPRKNNDAGTHYDVLTNENGEYKIKGVGYSFTECWLSKEGYYPSKYHLKLKQNGKFVSNLKFVLRKIRNPIPMYRKFVETEIPELSCKYGFDLERNDWVKPHGTGQQAHVIFHMINDRKAIMDYSKSLEITFFLKKSGLMWYKLDDFSKFQTKYYADEKVYTNQVILKRQRVKDKVLSENDFEDNEYLVLKIQSSSIKNNEAIEFFNYAVIFCPVEYGYGDSVRNLKFSYIFNPNINDINLEAAVHTNLFDSYRD